VLEGLLALAGLGAESMVRDVGWYFMDAGRRLERALQVAALLRHVLAPDGGGPDAAAGAGEDLLPTAVEALVLESVLIAGESIITYRRRHQGRPRPGGVVDLLLADRHNPRSVAYQLERFADDLAHLPAESDPGPGPGSGDGAAARAGAREALAAVQARLREVDAAEAADPRSLAVTLAEVHTAVTDLAASFARAHFVHAAPQRSLAGTPGWHA